MPYWTRQRDNDRHDYVLHNDWVLGDVQFSWRKIPRVSRGPTPPIKTYPYRIYCRKKQGIFGWGCTKWYFIYRCNTFEEMCTKLNKIIAQDNEKYWISVMVDVDTKDEEEVKEELEKKFCGFGSDGSIGFGY